MHQGLYIAVLVGKGSSMTTHPCVNPNPWGSFGDMSILANLEQKNSGRILKCL